MTLSRPWLVGLIVSAALNVFLVGGVVGALWARKAAPPPAAVPTVVQPVHALEDHAPEPPPPLAPAGAQRSPRQAPAGSTALPEDPPARPPLWAAGQGLSPDSRRALRQTLREANQRNQPITRQARAERQAALLALKAQPYDAAQVARRLAAARALDIQARGHVETALATYAATLSPVERAALTDGLARVYAPRQRSAQPAAQ